MAVRSLCHHLLLLLILCEPRPCHPLSSATVSSSCCHLLNDVHAAASCLQTLPEVSPLPDQPLNISILQYHSDVVPYAVYSAMINRVYAKHRGYRTHVVFGNSGFHDFPENVKWNYISILLTHLETLKEKRETLNDEYVMYVDSDFVFASRDFNLISLIEEHKGYDILISSEVSAISGVAQCGSIIMRNSQWTRSFLARWWERRTESESIHDQQAFSQLFLSNELQAQAHIKILPPEVINSKPLVPVHFTKASPVLHLMGQSTHLRSKIFSMGIQSVCRAEQSSNDFPKTLGITPDFVLNATLDEMYYHINNSIEVLFSSGDNNSSDNNLSKFDLSSRIDALREMRRYTNQLHGYNRRHIISSNISEIFALTKSLADKAKESDVVDKSLMLNVWNQIAEVGFEYANYESNMTEQELLSLVRQIDFYNNLIIDSIAEESRRLYYDRKVHLCAMLGFKYQRWRDLDAAAHYAQLGVNIYESFVASLGWTSSGLDALELLGTVACEQDRFPSGIETFRRAISVYDQNLYSISYQENDFLNYIRTLFNMGQCLFRSGDTAQAESTLIRAQSYLNEFSAQTVRDKAGNDVEITAWLQECSKALEHIRNLERPKIEPSVKAFGVNDQGNIQPQSKTKTVYRKRKLKIEK